MVGTRQKYRENGGGGGGKEMKRQRVIKMERGRLGEIEEGRKTMQSGTRDREEEKRQRDVIKAKNESL